MCKRPWLLRLSSAEVGIWGLETGRFEHWITCALGMALPHLAMPRAQGLDVKSPHFRDAALWALSFEPCGWFRSTDRCRQLGVVLVYR